MVMVETRKDGTILLRANDAKGNGTASIALSPDEAWTLAYRLLMRADREAATELGRHGLRWTRPPSPTAVRAA
jgi:hypothetical protein